MKYQIWLILLFLSPSDGYSQDYSNPRIVRLADSIVLSQTSQNFLAYIKQDNNVKHGRIINYANPSFESNRILDTSYTNSFAKEIYRVFYKSLTIKNEDLFIKNESHTYRALHIFIDFDSAFRPIKIPDFSVLEKAKGRIENAKFISRQDIEKILEPKFTFELENIIGSSNKSQSLIYLTYDSMNDSVLWIGTRFKTGEKTLEEKIVVNAETGTILSQSIQETKIVLR